MKISKIMGFELLDSRGNPTVGTRIVLDDSSTGFAISPSGASTGSHEAHELRDNDSNRYLGKGTLKAVENINTTIKNAVVGKSFENQAEFDDFLISLDGTENKSNLGANAILPSSLAFAKASCQSIGLELYEYVSVEGKKSLPRPMMNILNGGAHAKNNVEIQEFMIIPTAECEFDEKLRICAEIYHELGKILNKKGLSCGVGDEGGYAPKLTCDEEAIELIISAITSANYNTNDVKIGLDVASTEWYKNGLYVKPKTNKAFEPEQLIEYYSDLINSYPIISIEDPFAEDDFENFAVFTEKYGNKVQIVGDDLFVTNTSRLLKGIENNVANSILVKPNQIGTLTETIKVIELAKENNYNTIISHRSGETEDVSIADLAVGLDVGQIKTGAPCRSDRVSKYNRLLMIEKEL